jgi:hypothetical protein
MAGGEQLANQLRHVIVCGIATVKRAVIQTLDGKGGASKRYQLFVEGTGLQDVMATTGVKGREATSNHVMEMQQVRVNELFDVAMCSLGLMHAQRMHAANASNTHACRQLVTCL